jgi:hypothetical protein
MQDNPDAVIFKKPVEFLLFYRLLLRFLAIYLKNSRLALVEDHKVKFLVFSAFGSGEAQLGVGDKQDAGAFESFGYFRCSSERK